MEGEGKDFRGQMLSARDTERKYAEAIAQLTSLQAVHKQTVDSFEKEKLAFKVPKKLIHNKIVVMTIFV